MTHEKSNLNTRMNAELQEWTQRENEKQGGWSIVLKEFGGAVFEGRGFQGNDFESIEFV